MTTPTWDLDPGTLTATDGAPVTLIDIGPAIAESFYPDPTYVAAPVALRLDSPDGWSASMGIGTLARPTSWAMALVVTQETTGGDADACLVWAQAALWVGPGTLGYSGSEYGSPALSAPAAAGVVHVVGAVGDPTQTRLYVDGALVGVTDPAPTNYTGLELNAAGRRLLVHRVQGWDTAPSDFETDLAALAAQYTPAIQLEAAGTWLIAGTAEVAEGDPWADPVTPDPVPGGAQTPPDPPDPTPAPAGVPDPVIRRVSEIMPAPTLDDRGNPVDWAPTRVINEPYAHLQVVVEGVDITWWDGVPIPTPVWDRQEPFGSGTAAIELPQITAFHTLPDWCRAGANVDIRLVRLDNTIIPRFSGVLMSFGHRAEDGVFTLECPGVVFADDFQLRQPAFLTAPRDIGHVVAEVLNTTVSKRHADVTPVTTGCLTGVLGGWEPKITGYVTQLLATAITGGRQWTVRCDDRTPVLELKDTTTVSWTVTNGQRGVQIDLVEDHTQAPNVIYASGIGPDGGRWQNAMYPNWYPDDTPPYPWVSASRTFRIGDTDASTDTGNGVSVWQAKAGRPVTGVYTRADQVRVREIQRAGGIQVDGSLGPQTWATTFDTGANTGTLDCFYMPVAFSPVVMPRLYGPDGDDLGPNPAYDAGVIRVEDKVDYGQGASKTMGVRAAKETLARGIEPGWVGTVELTLDPEECSRYEIQEGSNGRIRGFRGQDLVVHVAQASYAGTVTLTVDTKARDFPTLDAILERERNATDPAKSIVKRLTHGSVGTDRATFDAESPAGQVPRHAVFSNLWDVRRIPFGAYGRVVRTEVTTDGPARSFAVAVFDRPITAAQLLSLAGNPLSATENPWSEYGDELDAAGLLMAWGWAKQPVGFWPQEYATPDRDGGVSVTGRFVDDASWEYASGQVPWLWVATIASGSCYVQARFWPGAD